jgi:hypothetical protein
MLILLFVVVTIDLNNFTECTNNFVQVFYNESSSGSIISCVFLNPSDTSEKTCCVIYQLCDQERIDSEMAPGCNKSVLQEIELKVFVNSSETYCYTVTASNDTYIIKVDANFTKGIIYLCLCLHDIRLIISQEFVY